MAARQTAAYLAECQQRSDRRCTARLAGSRRHTPRHPTTRPRSPRRRHRDRRFHIVCVLRTLRSEAGGDRRVDQILAWLSEEFDGLILFDEAHAMGGVAGGEGRFGTTAGSQQGIAGVELQNRLPRARVIYASATGASDVNNLAYATRLGL